MTPDERQLSTRPCRSTGISKIPEPAAGKMNGRLLLEIAPRPPDDREWGRSAVRCAGRPRQRSRLPLFKMLAGTARSVDLTLDKDGAELFAQALDEGECIRLEAALAALPTSVPGVRIRDGSQLKPFLAAAGPIGEIAAAVLGPEAHPVRAILLDKTVETNWALGWHQDRTIAVRERVCADGFGPWTVKSGLIQVEPPFDILKRMVTVRVHLDVVDKSNAPLRIVPGSHMLGRMPEAEIERTVATLGERLCLAERGDIWLYATPIVHASLAADPPRRRRVLQVDYSADTAPGPLAWRGV